MFNKNQIKERMEIVGADGVHVGTVDHVKGDRLNLTKPDTGQRPHGNRQHYLPGLVERVEGNQVRLSANGNVATQFEEHSGPTAGPAAAPFRPPVEKPATPFWNWNRVSMGAVGIVAVGVAGAALLNRKPATNDDFQYRLETDENVRLISSDKVDGTAVIGRNGETLGRITSFMVDKYSGRVA